MVLPVPLPRPVVRVLTAAGVRRGSQPRYGEMATGLRGPSSTISRAKILPAQRLYTANSRNKSKTPGRSFLYSAHEQFFLSPSPSEYPFPCTKTSISFIQYNFRFFPPCLQSVRKLALVCAASSASGILTAHRLCKTGRFLGSTALSMAVNLPLSFKHVEPYRGPQREERGANGSLCIPQGSCKHHCGSRDQLARVPRS